MTQLWQAAGGRLHAIRDCSRGATLQDNRRGVKLSNVQLAAIIPIGTLCQCAMAAYRDALNQLTPAERQEVIASRRRTREREAKARARSTKKRTKKIQGREPADFDRHEIPSAIETNRRRH